jgi:hypothetical protein
MIEIALVYLFIGISVAAITIQEDRLQKKIANGFNPNAKDGDKDGIVQEGTKWERKNK